MKHNLILRADGDATIGLGHVMRLLALVEILGNNFSYVFAIQAPSKSIVKLINDFGINVQQLSKQAYSTEAAFPPVQWQESSVVIIDGYQFDDHYQMALHRRGIRLVVVDDLHQSPVWADVLINHSPGIVAADYQVTDATRLLLGPAYSLVRRPFITHFAPPRPPRPTHSLLVCFGGADPMGLSVRYLNALLKLPKITNLGIITGGAFADDFNLQELLKNNYTSKIIQYNQLEATELRAIMTRYDVLLCPASTILVEGLLLGLAIVTGFYVSNQHHLADYTHQQQQAYSLGNLQDLPLHTLVPALQRGLKWLEHQPRQAYVTHLRHDELRDAVWGLVAV